MEGKLPLAAIGTLRCVELGEAQAAIREADADLAARQAKLDAHLRAQAEAATQRAQERAHGQAHFAQRPRSAEELLAEAQWEQEAKRREARVLAEGASLVVQVRECERRAAAARLRASESQARVEAVAGRVARERVLERREAEQTEEEHTEEALRGARLRH